MDESNSHTQVYQYRCSLLGHSGDVRSVMCATDQLVVSGSRDFTARTWIISKDSPQSVAVPQTVFRGHENYVSAVVAHLNTNSSTDSAQIMVFTGSHDKLIRAFESTCSEAVYTLRGHDDNVCALDVSTDGLLISGSWDKSVKLWRDKECLLTIQGHQAAVWCVLLLPQSSTAQSADSVVLLTGSADHTIKLWRVHGLARATVGSPPGHTLVRTLHGHADCVRSLARLDADRVLSASNDASVRAWHVATGQCVGEFYGHTSFVYSVATRSQAPVFVSSGEDRCVLVWPVPTAAQWGPGKQFEPLQRVPLPCQSVWSVDLTSQLDILAGCSDSSIRMFSRDPERQASQADAEAYEAELSKAEANTAASAATGDLDRTKLPGVEALLKPGKREGHVIVIQQDGREVCYQWSAAEARWMQIGDVVGTGQSKLPVYNGREYDFVFSVDISDDVGLLKLPYNRTEDPWTVAQRFIEEHNLPQDYLDTVAQFIIQNAGPPTVAPVPTGACDPFTGADRYIPRPLHNQQPSISPTVAYLPSTTFIPLKSLSISSLLQKLESFNQSQPPTSQISATHWDLLRSFTFELSDSQASELASALLTVVTKWPSDKIFPILDVIRCLVFWPSASSLIFSEEYWPPIHACSLAQPDLPPANCLLVLRLLANGLAADGPPCVDTLARDDRAPVPRSVSTAVMLAHDLDHMLHSANFQLTDRKPLQIACATYIHNLAIFSHMAAELPATARSSLTRHVPHLTVLPSLCIRLGVAILSIGPGRGAGAVTLFHPDAIFALLLAVGTALITGTRDLTESSASDSLVKAHRVRLITAAASTGSNGPDSGSQTTELDTLEALASAWEKVRAVLAYWAQTPTCSVKVRGCATALLQLLE